MEQKEVGNETSRYLVVGSSAAGCMRCGDCGSECAWDGIDGVVMDGVIAAHLDTWHMSWT